MGMQWSVGVGVICAGCGGWQLSSTWVRDRDGERMRAVSHQRLIIAACNEIRDTVSPCHTIETSHLQDVDVVELRQLYTPSSVVKSEPACACTALRSLLLLRLLFRCLAYSHGLPALVHLTISAAVQPLMSCYCPFAPSTIITITILLETFIVLVH